MPVLLEAPYLVAIDFPAVESVKIVKVVFFASPVSRRKFVTNSPSLVPLPMAYSSASPDDSAIVSCVLEASSMQVPSRKTDTHVVDFLVVVSPAQSEST